MTPAQFAALADLLQMRAGPAQEAAQLVLVAGITSAEAARRTGLSPQAASQAVVRARRGLALAQQAAGIDPAATQDRPTI